MAISYPDLVADTDAALSWLNRLKTRLIAYLNSIPGGALQAGTVTQDKLAKGKSFFAVSFWIDSNLTTANVTNLVSFRLPDVDGASNTSIKYLGISVGFRTVATALGSGALAVVKQNGSTIQSLDIDSSEISAAGGTSQANVAAVACESNDEFDVDFTAGATGDVTGVTIVLYFSINHVGT